MNTLIAVGAVNALYLTLLVQAKKHKELPDRILSQFLIFVSMRAKRREQEQGREAVLTGVEVLSSNGSLRRRYCERA